MTFDPATLQVIWGRLVATVDEAAATLVRTSFSTIVRDSNDYACVITDATGRSLAQSSLSIPSFIATLPRTVRAMLERFPAETLAPGDILVTNDPWLGTGHLPDLSMAVPLFRDGRLVAFAATAAHLPDIGGRIRSPDARELFEEGLRIPISKLVSAGTVNEQLVELIEANVRVPMQVIGDIWAQASANHRAGTSLQTLLDDYALNDLVELASEIHGRSERAMRKAITELPDGSYEFEVRGDGVTEPIVIHIAVRVHGDSLEVDYTGTSAQIPFALNVVPAYTFAYTAFALKCVLDPHLPNNEGCFGPISVTAPLGSILNPVAPAPVGARALTGHLLPPAVFGALHGAVPDRVQAASGSPLWAIQMAGEEPEGRYAGLFFFNGGQGASSRRSGVHCLSFPSNMASTPVEVIERNLPLRVIEKSLRNGSGGSGANAGGMGQTLRLQHIGKGSASLAFMAERIKNPAFGLAGGGSGATGRVLLNGSEIDPKARFHLNPGDELLCQTPGGGGYGVPATNDF
ncbi:MAG: hydantoinase B/oxoprolinase family protein [Trueperaceae bacterium]